MLNGTRCVLRLPELTDASFMLRIENDERYWHLSNNTSPFSIEDMWALIQSSSSDLSVDHQLRMVIEEKTTGLSCGLIDVFEYDPKNQRAGLGIFICEDYRRKGIGSEALKLLCDYLFTVFELHQLWSRVLVSNEASMNLFRSAGFIQTGIKNDWLFFGNQFHNEAFFQLRNNK